MKGCYCLVIRLHDDSTIKIGKRLGKTDFKKGYYVYVGSAMNSLDARLKRHLSDEKKLHWHVDYLLKNRNSKIADVIYNESSRKIECNLSESISKKGKGVKDFGCSDCECDSHLYYFKNKKEAIESIEGAYNSIAMEFHYLKYET